MSNEVRLRRLRSSNTQRRTFIKTGAGIATTSLIGITGCLGGGSSSGDEVTLVTKESSDAARNWYDQMAQGFEEESGTSVSIEYTDLSVTDHVAEMLQTGNPPEIATADAGQTGEFMQRDLLADVSSVIDTFNSEYDGEIAESVKIQDPDGNDMLLPLYTNPTQVWYWNDAYEEYGLDNSPSLSWDEYLEISSEIHNQGDMNGTVVPSASTQLSGFKFWNFLFSNSGQVCQRVDGEVEIALDQDEYRDRAIETLEFLNELHSYSPDASDYGWNDILEDYTSQSSAHCIYGPRAKIQIIENRPELKNESRPHFPISNTEETFVSNQGGMVLFKDAENRDSAQKFLEFTARENRLLDLLTSVAPLHNFPTIASIAEMDEYRNSEFISENFREEDIEIVTQSFENGKSMSAETDPINPYAPALWSTREIGTMMYNVNIDGKDPSQAIDDTAGRLREALSDLKE